MNKRIIYNLVFAFVLIPIAISIRDYIQIDILKDPAKYAGTFSNYFQLSLPFVFGAIPLVFFLFVLLPYAVMISKLEGLAQRHFLVKAAVLMGIITVVFSLFGTFSNVWRYPYI